MSTTANSPVRGNAVLLLWGHISPAAIYLNDLDAWWSHEHLPERLSIPGFNRARRYQYIDGDAEDERHYLTLYDVDSLETLTSAAYMEKLNNPTDGTKKYLPMLSGMERAACTILGSWTRHELEPWSGREGMVSGTLMMQVASFSPSSPPSAERLDTIKERVEKWFKAAAKVNASALSCCLLLEDAEITGTGSGSASYQDVRLGQDVQGGEKGARLVLLVEGTETLDQYENVLVRFSRMEVVNRWYDLMLSLSN